MPLPEEPDAAAAQLRRRKITVAVVAGGVSVLVVTLIIALMATNPDDGKSVSAASISTASTTSPPAVTPPVTAATTSPTQPAEATDAPISAPPATAAADTGDTDAAVPPTAPPTRSTTATTAPRPPGGTTTPTSAPAKPVAVANCADVGTINIPATGVNSTILAERKAYSDGLLCGNHAADHVAPGVDILPGFASLSDSVAGGSALQGQVPAIIFGHRNSHNRPFLNNNKLHPGDAVVITNADGTTLNLKVDSVQLLSLKAATTMLLTPSPDGKPQIRLVCCSHADGSPGGVNYRWIVTVSEA